MQNLIRRPSGTYAVRLVIPTHLRRVFGKREFIESTGTTNLAIAKLFANVRLSEWRQRLLDADRLLMPSLDTLDPRHIIKIAQGHPFLKSGGWLSLADASAASGIPISELLRVTARGQLKTQVRVGTVEGHLVPFDDLDLNDQELGASGGRIIPSPEQLPNTSMAFIATGHLNIPAQDMAGVLEALLGGTSETALHAYEVAGRSGMLFVPTREVRISLDTLEVESLQVEGLRSRMASLIEPNTVTEAKERLKAASAVPKTDPTKGKSSRLLSEALDAFVANRLRHDLSSEGEILRIRAGCSLLIELGGDLTLNTIDAEHIRHFRDSMLSQVPAHENKIRLQHGTTNVKESMAVAATLSWPVMSPGERDKRMNWIKRWFRWLHEQGWVENDPSLAIRGESVLTRAERRKAKIGARPDQARDAFAHADLQAIFGADWFRTGRGQLTKQGTYRTFMPLYYWLPLLGLFTGGGRINELCQLRLEDIGQTPSGTWFVNIKETDEDQKLKNTPSQRQVPLHPLLISLGLPEWIEALQTAGYRRLFPELKRDEEKGYGKAATKWFSKYMDTLGFARDGSKVFHSFRHTYTNALPADTPERLRRQLVGHTRGESVHETTYMKEATPDDALRYVKQLSFDLPSIANFDVAAGLQAITDALKRKNRGLGDDDHEKLA